MAPKETLEEIERIKRQLEDQERAAKVAKRERPTVKEIEELQRPMRRRLGIG